MESKLRDSAGKKVLFCDLPVLQFETQHPVYVVGFESVVQTILVRAGCALAL